MVNAYPTALLTRFTMTRRHANTCAWATLLALLSMLPSQVMAQPYAIVDTGQVRCYDNRVEIRYPRTGAAFFGQDAQYNGHQPAYKNNGDGTISDLNTGLMWQHDPGAKKTYAQAVAGVAQCRTGGYDDWRLPTIKELYSLILFTGVDPDPRHSDPTGLTPFIDTRYFSFQYGRAEDGDRIIDSQFVSATQYVSTTMNGNPTVFGVNFADGRIKGYPRDAIHGRGAKTFYVLYVRGNAHYGQNDFHDNGDGTVTDRATGLMWMKVDSGHLKAGRKKDGALNWEEALAWAEQLDYAGHSDWRLPNAKELQSLVDYTRSPDATHSPAIDPVFQVTPIRNEGGARDFPCYWTSTTHARADDGGAGVYLAFGRALGWMPNPRTGVRTLMDVHGAGAQRSDVKAGDPASLPQGRGPQGDVMRIYNEVRCVRDGAAQPRTAGPLVQMTHAVRLPTQTIGGQGGHQPTPADFIRRLDRDGDGKVSRAEFDGPREHFDDFDRNRDGFISMEEAPQGPPPSRRPARSR